VILTPIAQDIGEALKWYIRAAEQNDGKAQWYAARIYGNDASSRYDSDKAIHWYGRAALSGIAPAQLALGILYSRGRGVPVDMVRARMWLKFAAGDILTAPSVIFARSASSRMVKV
jgi:TPR repeat protein